MEWKKGILIKKGDWYQVKYKKSQFKTSNIDIPKSGIEINDNWVNEGIEFQMVSGSVTEIKYQGENLKTGKQKGNTLHSTHRIQQGMGSREKEKKIRKTENRKTKEHARAPYNFIPLNQKVAFNSSEATFDKFHKDRNTGYIKLEIKNLTPLFIRQISGYEKHFGYGKKYGIPGSSMRGMIRTMCEVISFGRFGKTQDNRLYYRGTLDTMGKIKAGVMKYEDGKYKVHQCSYDVTNNKRLVRNSMNLNDSGDQIEFTTGKFGNKYNKFIFSNISEKPAFTISEKSKVFEEYKNDNSRESVDIFEESRKKRFPVFFQLNSNDEVDSIGFAKYHRIPYVKSISEHMLPQIQKSKKIKDADLVQGLFGDDFNDGMIASRLAFGDLMSTDAKHYELPQLLKILSSPKPTTFQHYLEQNDSGKLNNWNSDANIRGFKMHWHRKTSDEGTIDISWNESEGTNKSNSHSERVKPIKPAATFKGKIWFQNLSGIELGLLLMALEPNFKIKENEKIAHKIGLAKPLGLGSIEIKISDLKVFNTSAKGYYSSYTPMDKQKYREIEAETCKNDYDIECAQKIGLKGSSIWDTPRLKELRAMMIWNDSIVKSPDWLQKTRYMEITRGQIMNSGKVIIKGVNEFEKRPILPSPIKFKDAKNIDFIKKHK